MERKDVIPASDFCTYHHISFSFVESLRDAGLVDVDIIADEHYLYLEQLKNLESLVRLHTELDINPEGVEAIAHLLQRISYMQQEIQALKQKLQLYGDII
jgi:hypothetical protein